VETRKYELTLEVENESIAQGIENKVADAIGPITELFTALPGIELTLRKLRV